MRQKPRHVRRLFLVLGLLAALDVAHASSTYPAEIQKQLQLSYTPQCAICHANGVTGTGTVTTNFGLAMRARGLVCCDIASLDTALMALEGEMSPYINYLKEGLNPNDPGAGAVPPIAYGCFNVTGQGPTPGTGGVALVLLALLVAFRPRAFRRGR
jgi:MYXO-CTERM domain-containing protein